MIKYKVGDLCKALLDGDVNVIGHQANCFNTMNSGVAKAIKLAFPDAWEADQETVKGDKGKFGDLSLGIHYYGEGGVGAIYNLYGQYNYGYDQKGYTDYSKLEQALTVMRDDLLTGSNTWHIGFPKIGAGLGGGDWDTIAEIIDRLFADFDVTIYVLREEDLC